METNLNPTTRKKSKLTVRQLAIVGMLSGISIFLGVSKLGFIPLPTMKATIMHVPVIIGAIIEGPIVGALIGLIFGIFSMVDAFSNPTITSFLFYNPIIAVLPRILIGIGSYYIYHLFNVKKNSLSLSVTAICGSLINTCGVLGFAYLFYAEKLSQALNLGSTKAAGIFCATTAITNGIPEAILSAVIVTPIVVSVRKLKK